MSPKACWKHGEKQPVKSIDWVRALKLAIISEDKKALLALTNQIPNSFEDQTQLQEAMALTKQAIELMQSQKNELSHELAKLKKARKYL